MSPMNKCSRGAARLSIGSATLCGLTACADVWGMNPPAVDATDLNFYNVALAEINTCLSNGTNCSIAGSSPEVTPHGKNQTSKECFDSLVTVEMNVSYPRRSLRVACKVADYEIVIETYDDESQDQYDLITFISFRQ